MSDALPFRCLTSGKANAVINAIGYAMHRSRSHDAVTRVFDTAGNVIETHGTQGRFQKLVRFYEIRR